ncbi:mucin-19-like, partial [Mizuhopecten yessoensis]|uniref:mucin-19-like n=1 Tax=Mizuhopecten yessoensis TaxID=6573 RepID=UPI000B45826D
SLAENEEGRRSEPIEPEGVTPGEQAAPDCNGTTPSPLGTPEPTVGNEGEHDSSSVLISPLLDEIYSLAENEEGRRSEPIESEGVTPGEQAVQHSNGTTRSQLGTSEPTGNGTTRSQSGTSEPAGNGTTRSQSGTSEPKGNGTTRSQSGTSEPTGNGTTRSQLGTSEPKGNGTTRSQLGTSEPTGNGTTRSQSGTSEPTGNEGEEYSESRELDTISPRTTPTELETLVTEDNEGEQDSATNSTPLLRQNLGETAV